MKKNNKEKINLIITEPAQKEPESFNPSSYYQEIMDIDEKNEDDIISYDEKKDYINLFLESFVNKIEEVLRSFYFMELFYISINKDNKSSLIRDDLKQRVKKWKIGPEAEMNIIQPGGPVKVEGSEKAIHFVKDVKKEGNWYHHR